MFEFERHPHRRFDPLRREWILVSPQRTARPWQGQVEPPSGPPSPPYDPACYLCPGNERAGGVRNPAYGTTFVFDNDYPALVDDTPEDAWPKSEGTLDSEGLLQAHSERGTCRVVCFSPRHDLTLATMAAADVRPVVDAWCMQVTELGQRAAIGYVQIFENRGAMMGASNPHPHGQIWASEHVPNGVATEQASLLEWRRSRGVCMLCAYTSLELRESIRVVTDNAHFVAVVPFWAIWPFETMVLPRRHLGRMPDLAAEERDAFAAILHDVTARYDRLFATSFPYSFGIHQAPVDGEPHDEWHLHAHFLPPLLRSATIRKFMVGYELLAMPQRDITPEDAAGRLRALLPPPG